jgi:glycosyltransferase involved in cell wall biosynthesis
MKICLVGIYDINYPRNSFVKKGLSHMGEVIECSIDPRKAGLYKYIELVKTVRQLQKVHSFDMVWVAFPGQTVVPIARLLFSCPIIFDAFTSLYDSNVYDRKLYSRWSVQGIRDFIYDIVALRCAHGIVTDTKEHAHFFESKFGVPNNKIVPLYVGTDINIFDPNKYGQIITNHTDEKALRIHFHGSFIPLQGIDTIIRALALIKDIPIVCTCIGRGSIKDSMIKLAHDLGIDSLHFIDRVPYSELPAYIAQSDICLGIFGKTEKTQRVIPNKVYEYAAMGKAIITADTQAVREVFSIDKDIIGVQAGDHHALAEQIRALSHDYRKRRELGASARNAIVHLCSPEQVGVCVAALNKQNSLGLKLI